MAGRKAKADSRLSVARYQVDRLDPESAAAAAAIEPAALAASDRDETALSGQRSMDARAQYVEITIQQSMRRGDFDALPGSGKPLTGLTAVHDPDWWIRRKIEREKLTGLGPPALTLRTEDAQLDARLDDVASDKRVREIVEDFNRRVIEARRQLQGGPPVVTKPRDVDGEVSRWNERRAIRLRELRERRDREAAEYAAMSRRERRARRRRQAD